VDDAVGTLLVIGHEPTMSALALGLGHAEGTNSTAAERISAKFPTSAITVLSFPGAWRQLELGVATLVDFVVPR
jgi:phosphohistidine phosphatase